MEIMVIQEYLLLWCSMAVVCKMFIQSFLFIKIK